MLLQATFVFCLLASFKDASAILGGYVENWNRHGYLVKILSFPDEQRDQAFRCTGALITSSLVLTSPDCVKGVETDTGSRMVTVVIPERRYLLGADGKRITATKEVPALVANSTQSWALLRIPEQTNMKFLCPVSPGPKRLSQLNLRPTLRGRSIVEIKKTELKKRKCFLIGFETDIDSSFRQERAVKKLPLQPIEKSTHNSLFVAKIKFPDHTACYDDIGAPLFCEDPKLGIVQVGFFTELFTAKHETLGRERAEAVAEEPTTANSAAETTTMLGETGAKNAKKEGTGEEDDVEPDDKRNRRKRDYDYRRDCTTALEMQLSIISDDESFFEALEIAALPSVAEIYSKCDFDSMKNASE